MKQSRVWFALASGLVLSGVLASDAPAQQGNRPAAGTRPGGEIALIDTGVIFKNNARFKQFMNDLQGDMERAEQQMKKERDSLRALSERLNEYKAGSAEYKQIEEEVAKRTADMNVRFQLQKKEFMKAESHIWHTILQEIQQEVDAYAQANGIAAVLKFSSEQADPDNPEQVLRGLNNTVVWYNRGLDITQTILESLNRRALQTDRRNGPVNLPPQQR